MADQSKKNLCDIEKHGKDEDLDALLDDALQDFDKPQATGRKEDIPSAKPAPKESEDDAILESLWDDDALLKMSESWNDVMEEMSKEDPNLMAEFQKFQQSFNPSGFHPNTPKETSSGESNNPQSFKDHISKTLQDLTSNMNDLKVGGEGEMPDISEMMREMQSNMGDADIEGESSLPNGDAFMGMMQGMMENLLSKELLYPSLKEIKDKYPTWLENNKNKVKDEDYKKYEQQNDIVCHLCSLFETEREDDKEEVKKERVTKIVDLMQKMQIYGQPPPDMMAEIAKESQDEGATMAPNLPTDCSVM